MAKTVVEGIHNQLVELGAPSAAVVFDREIGQSILYGLISETDLEFAESALAETEPKTPTKWPKRNLKPSRGATPVLASTPQLIMAEEFQASISREPLYKLYTTLRSLLCFQTLAELDRLCSTCLQSEMADSKQRGTTAGVWSSPNVRHVNRRRHREIAVGANLVPLRVAELWLKQIRWRDALAFPSMSLPTPTLSSSLSLDFGGVMEQRGSETKVGLLEWAAGGVQGQRTIPGVPGTAFRYEKMEDVIVVDDPVGAGLKTDAVAYIFVLADGHGGRDAAEWFAIRVPGRIRGVLRELLKSWKITNEMAEPTEDLLESALGSSETFRDQLSTQIRNAIKSLDNEFCELRKRQLMDHISSSCLEYDDFTTTPLTTSSAECPTPTSSTKPHPHSTTPTPLIAPTGTPNRQHTTQHDISHHPNSVVPDDGSTLLVTCVMGRQRRWLLLAHVGDSRAVVGYIPHDSAKIQTTPGTPRKRNQRMDDDDEEEVTPKARKIPRKTGANTSTPSSGYSRPENIVTPPHRIRSDTYLPVCSVRNGNKDVIGGRSSSRNTTPTHKSGKLKNSINRDRVEVPKSEEAKPAAKVIAYTKDHSVHHLRKARVCFQGGGIWRTSKTAAETATSSSTNKLLSMNVDKDHKGMEETREPGPSLYLRELSTSRVFRPAGYMNPYGLEMKSMGMGDALGDVLMKLEPPIFEARADVQLLCLDDVLDGFRQNSRRNSRGGGGGQGKSKRDNGDGRFVVVMASDGIWECVSSQLRSSDGNTVPGANLIEDENAMDQEMVNGMQTEAQWMVDMVADTYHSSKSFDETLGDKESMSPSPKWGTPPGFISQFSGAVFPPHSPAQPLSHDSNEVSQGPVPDNHLVFGRFVTATRTTRTMGTTGMTAAAAINNPTNNSFVKRAALSCISLVSKTNNHDDASAIVISV